MDEYMRVRPHVIWPNWLHMPPLVYLVKEGGKTMLTIMLLLMMVMMLLMMMKAQLVYLAKVGRLILQYLDGKLFVPFRKYTMSSMRISTDTNCVKI